MADILDGKKMRDHIRKNLIEKVGSFAYIPKLLIIDIGGEKETESYVNQKKIFGKSIGVLVEHKIFERQTPDIEIISYIENACHEENVAGVIVQLPIPGRNGDEKERILNAIKPEKDVDGLTVFNIHALYNNEAPRFIPATARGVIELLDFYNIKCIGKAVIIGSSNLTGKPIGELLRRRGMEVVVCDENTKDIELVARTADILVSATGVPHLVGKDFIKQGQVVVDVGYTIQNTGDGLRISGDVAFEEIKDVASYITPVPGGVGPMTVAALFENLLGVSFEI